MKIRMELIVVVGLTICSCNNGRKSGSSTQISGAYAREYSFKVVNLETGTEIGMRTIRDTMFIRKMNEGYEISNRKWKLNDYDKEGWRSMEHAEDRPMPTFNTTLDLTKRVLSAESAPLIYLDLERGMIFKDKAHRAAYQKVK